MPLSAEKLNDLRQRVLNNQPWTEEEHAEAMREMIKDRLDKLTTPEVKKGRKGTVKTTVELDDLIPK